MKQLWGSGFSKALNKSTNDFNSSLRFDKRLYKYDITGSIAHAAMLSAQGILTKEENELIANALKQILSDIEDGNVNFDFDLEDIHTFVEKLLTERIGDTGKKLHTARSRNDQVALDVRMYVKDELENLLKQLVSLIKVLLSLAKEHTTTIMPGYTHLQRAQPITFAHHLGAYIEMFKRDYERITDTFKRVNILPLGAGALATGPHNINRYKTAELLGFDDICLNSLDAVSDRDFVIETLSDLSMIMMHTSRFCEEIILWASKEFQFVKIDDGYATGSSLMPQKKNPDIAELIRGKTGRVYGSLVSLLTTMKSLPLAYNKDMQEDKEPLFDAFDTVKMCLSILPEMLETITVNKDKMLKACSEGFLNATDLADYLVKKGLPFRDAHEASGKAVRYCIENDKTLDTMNLSEYKKINGLFEDDLYAAIDIKNSVKSRKVIGGPAKEAVEKVILINEEWIKQHG
ncbi:MAG: argininosuccinate lyase [Candidatus Gastranaerophilales bacterium]|nr:argininosuccinate lyase [Candidatus Gastranaerophilales bacterium]